MSATTSPTPPGVHIAPEELQGVTLRALLLAVALTVLSSYWVDQAEVVTFFCQITESVPPVPAVAGLILLVGLGALTAHLLRRGARQRRETLLVYIFLTVATTIPGCGIARFFINTIPVLFYFDTPENEYASYQQYVPAWLVPHDREVIRQLYEGAPGGRIPWGAWWQPLALWLVLFLALWVVLLAVVLLFRRQWAEREKLTFPLLFLPLEVTGSDEAAGTGGFFRNRIMWVGFTVAVLYNVSNIINAYNPAVKCLGKYYDLGALFTEAPLSALRPVTLHYRPEMIGFGYLVSSEVALSVWVFYVLFKLESLVAALVGYEQAGFPFQQEQGLGAYLAVGLFLVWVARGHLGGVLRRGVLGDRSVDDSGEPVRYRTALLGLVLGAAVCLVWAQKAGLAAWVWLLYFALIVLVALVYARIRAEVGVPLIWMFPYYQHYKAIKFVLGSEPLKVGGQWNTLTVFSTLVILSRGYYPSVQGYQVEGLRLAELTGLKQRDTVWWLTLSCLVGWVVAMWLHLRSYYEYGAGGLRALEGWGAGIAKQEYTELVTYATAAAPRDVPRTIAAAAGFGLASGLTVARMVFLRFPLHPLAYCMATAYGELIWGTFLIVWLVKTIVLKVGGMRLYRRLIPGFIGLALGHFFAAGVAYGLIGAYGSEAFRRYAVWFG